MQLSTPSAWRLDFFGMLAELADELLPSAFDPALKSGDGVSVEQLWASHALASQPAESQDLVAATHMIIERAQEQGLLAGRSSEDLFQLLLGRTLDRGEPGATSLSREDTLSAILRSAEFSRSLPWIAKSVINRGQWNYFVHVPKTAGSQFQAMLWTQFGPGGLLRAFPDDEIGVAHSWAPAAWLRRLLHDDSPLVWVSGHLALHDVRPMHSAWPTDRVVTVVRDPVDVAISAVNYFYGLRQTLPEAAEQYFAAHVGLEAGQDLDSIDLERALISIAKSDRRLRPSFYFNDDILDAALRRRLVVGFQENLLALLELVVGEGGLHLPQDVMENRLRINPSTAVIDAATLDPFAMTELVRASHEAVVDYVALRKLAAGAPYVSSHGWAR